MTENIEDEGYQSQVKKKDKEESKTVNCGNEKEKGRRDKRE